VSSSPRQPVGIRETLDQFDRRLGELRRQLAALSQDPQPTASGKPAPIEQEPLAAAVASEIEAVVAAAEHAANEFRRQVEASAQEQAARARQDAEADARRIRQEAAKRAAEYLADSRRIIDEFTAERVSKISRLTDELIQGAESLQRRFTETQAVRGHIYELISTLGAVAEAIALEARVSAPELPGGPREAAPPKSPDHGAGGEPTA
jgi:hypothetical protein